MKEKAYEFHGCYIPKRMMPGIKRYVENGIKPGDFLTAVIQNNLLMAYRCADSENIKNIPAYIAYFYNKCPMGCWGSPEKMKNWIKKFNKEQKEEQC